MYEHGIFWMSLPPCGIQKSFYGKAKIGYRFLDEQHKVSEYFLKSYDTIVCKITANNEFQKLWDDYSHTTMKHINAFRRYYGFADMSKKEWDGLLYVTNAM